MYTEQMSQALSIAAAPAHGATLNNAAASSGGVDMSKFHRVLFLIDVGTLSAGASVTPKLQQSPDNASWSDFPGGAGNAITAASRVMTIEARADELSAGCRYFRAVATETAGFNAIVTIIPLAGEAVQKPGSAQDHSSVSQRLVV
jgi:hypothetical protein